MESDSFENWRNMIETHELKLLSKSLRPMPTEQDGFTNKEERFRRRYIDMNVNLDVRDRFVRRSEVFGKLHATF